MMLSVGARVVSIEESRQAQYDGRMGVMVFIILLVDLFFVSTSPGCDTRVLLTMTTIQQVRHCNTAIDEYYRTYRYRDSCTRRLLF